MASGYRVIDEGNWERAVHCAVFRNYAEPQYCVTFELDISNFLAKVRAKGLSFTFAMVYAVAHCANRVEAFRYRFLDGRVVLFDTIDTAFTYISPGEELFKVVRVPFAGTMEEYVAHAAERTQSQTEYFTGPLGNDVFQFSPLPWVQYTHVSHTISGKKDNATPLFDWGKYHMQGGAVLLPFSVQAHHSFVDGIHIGRLAEGLQAYLDEF